MEFAGFCKVEEIDNVSLLQQRLDNKWTILAIRIQESVNERDGVYYKESKFVYSIGRSCLTVLIEEAEEEEEERKIAEANEKKDAEELKNVPICVSTFDL